MPNLIDLPDELILHTLAFLEDTGAVEDRANNAALASLSRTNNFFKHISQPLLYVGIRLQVLDGADPFRALWMLLRTLVSRPDLGQRVTTLSIDEGSHRVSLENALYLDLVQHKEVKIAVLETFPYFESASIGFTDLVYTLLCRLPNIEHMYIRTDPKACREMMLNIRIGDMAARIEDEIQRRPCLPAVKTFSVDWRSHLGDKKDYGHKIFWPIVTMRPTLTTFIQHRFVTRDPWAIPPCFEHQVTLTEVCFKEAYIPSEAMEKMVKICKALKKFTFTSLQREDTVDRQGVSMPAGTHQFLPNELFPALTSCLGRLEWLHADFRGCYQVDRHGANYMSDDDVVTYPPFHIFERLRHLWIESFRLARWDHLPPTLESLTLVECTEFRFCMTASMYFEGMVGLKRTICPALHTLRILVSHEPAAVVDLVKAIAGRHVARREKGGCCTIFPDVGFALEIFAFD